MNFIELIPLARDLIIAGCAVITVSIAKRGLETWRRQMKGQGDYQLAKLMLVNLCKYRAGVRVIRSPMQLPHETVRARKAMMKEGSESAEDASELDLKVQVFTQRWKLAGDAFAEILAAHFEAQAIWGEEFDKPIRRLAEFNEDLHTAFERFFDNRRRPHDKDPDFDAVQRVVYSKFGKGDDEFMERLNVVSEEIKVALRPFLQ